MINLLWFAHLLATSEVLAIGVKSGVDRATLHRKPLRELGCVRTMLPDIAAATVADAVTANSPRLPGADEVLGVLRATF